MAIERLELDDVVVLALEDSEYDFVAIGTSYVNASSQLAVFDGFTGKVLYDSILSNGYASNRYLEFVYEDHTFVKDAVREVSSFEVPEEVKSVIRSYWQENPRGLTRGSLLTGDVARLGVEMGVWDEKGSEE